MTKAIEISCHVFFSLDLLKSQDLKETLKNSSCSSNSTIWLSNSENTQEYMKM